MIVKEWLVQKTMILPDGWERHSTNEGSFCQMALGWLGYKDNLFGGYENEEHLWLRVRRLVNDSMGTASSSARSRIYYQWNGKMFV